MSSVLFAFYDTETTGVDTLKDDIISFGCALCRYKYDSKLEYSQMIILDTFHQYINTPLFVGGSATKVHHITKDMLKDASLFPQVINEFKQFIQKHVTKNKEKIILAGYNNNDFDDQILFCNFIKHQLSFSDFIQEVGISGFLDLYKIVQDFRDRKLIPLPQTEEGLCNLTLRACHNSFVGEPLANAHDALNDAVGTVKVINAHALAQHLGTMILQQYMTNIKKTLEKLERTATQLIRKQTERAKSTEVIVSDQSSIQKQEQLDQLALNQLEEWDQKHAPVERPFGFRTCLKCMSVVPIQHSSGVATIHSCSLPSMFAASSHFTNAKQGA